MIRILLIGLILFGMAQCCRAGLILAGEPFHTDATIRWSATNLLPAEFVVYETAPKTFPAAAVSNAMAVGKFKPLNSVPSQNKGMLLFQDTKEPLRMTRSLKIESAQGVMHYYNRNAEGAPVTNVPSFAEAEILALKYLAQFGIDTNAIIPKPWPRSQTEITSYDKKGGKETGKTVSMRGVFLFRQIDGVQAEGNYFLINFCNNAEPSMFELSWPELRATKRCKTATPDEIIAWIKQGRTVCPNPDAEGIFAKKLLVTKIIPKYLSGGDGQQQKTVFPFAEIEMTANVEGTNKTVFYLHCPLITADN